MMRLIGTALAFVAVCLSGIGDISRANADETSQSVSSLDSYGSDSAADLGGLSSSLLPVEVRDATTSDGGQQRKPTKTTKIMLAAIAAVTLAMFTAGGWLASRSPAERQQFYHKYIPYMEEKKPVSGPPIQKPAKLLEYSQAIKEALASFLKEVQQKIKELEAAKLTLQEVMAREMPEELYKDECKEINHILNDTTKFLGGFVSRWANVTAAVKDAPQLRAHGYELTCYGILLKSLSPQMRVAAMHVDDMIKDKYSAPDISPDLKAAVLRFGNLFSTMENIEHSIVKFNEAVDGTIPYRNK